MPITRQEKENHVAELKDLISKSKVIILWDYLGLNAEEISEIRASVRNVEAINKVFKNRIAAIAFKDSGKEEILEHLSGPSSFLFIEKEDTKAVAILDKFIKNNDKISFKAGYIDGEFYDTAAITEMAGLPSKEDLLSMLLSVLQGSIRNLAYVLSQVGESLPASKTTPTTEKEVVVENKEESKSTETVEEVK